jgi:protein-S-isoprenylcysteine O-methyltransferase Ste14
MARQWFKRAWTKIVPPAIERSTYVLFASSALILLFWQWRPITTIVWDVQTPAYRTMLWVAFAAGWTIVLISTFLISHFELFGLSQVYAYFTNRPLGELTFGTPFFYKAVRHPIYMGFTIAFWATPHMTAGHAFFAFMCTAYMLVAIQFEEHDLIKMYGERYLQYRREVSMILPLKRQPSTITSARSAGK